MKKTVFFSFAFVLMLSSGYLQSGQNQLLPTKLRVTVLDNLGNIQEGATVVLFGNDEDYRQETNPIAGPQRTDKKGRVTFKNIPSQAYFIMVQKGDKNNDGQGVRTEKLDEGKMNKINIVIR